MTIIQIILLIVAGTHNAQFKSQFIIKIVLRFQPELTAKRHGNI